MKKSKIAIAFAAIAVVVTIALVTGVAAFDSQSTQKLSKGEAATLASLDAKDMLQEANATNKLTASALKKANEEAKANGYYVPKPKKKKVKKVEPKVEETSEEIEETEEATQKESESDNGWKSLGEFKLTAYCGCSECNGGYGCNTASGTTPKAGRTIAVDPSVIPLGTKVKIDGEVYTAEDTGGAIQGHIIDIFVSEHNACYSFGVQHAEVFIKE
ncbi:MAG: 3D domain-containing protein [Eubacterium sp.]|nr:3D domain-containing protein [Eubacterium sp.]